MTPWNPDDVANFDDLFTVVTMMTKDKHGRSTGERHILQGSVSEIFSVKVNGKLPDRIVVFASAGRGKTTAVAKLAYDWAHSVQGSPLQELPLLFLVHLRNTDENTSLGQAIISQHLSDVEDLTPGVLEKFIYHNQRLCYIVLDGLDEFKGKITSEQNQCGNIVSILRYEKYQQCRVLITSRPLLEKDFEQGETIPRIYTKMVIEGFSTENSQKYVDKFFDKAGDISKGNALKIYLNQHPVMHELVKTPLFCLMVCHLWAEDLLSDIETQSALLDSVNLFLWHHAQARREITEESFHETITALGKIALKGLLKDSNKLVFTQEDFENNPQALDVGCELGIISRSSSQTKQVPRRQMSPQTTIEFYHQLAQEHTVGKYLAESCSKFLMQFKVSRLDFVLRQIQKQLSDYEHVLRFAAGASTVVLGRVMETILSSSTLEESEKYRILLDCSSEARDSGGRVSSFINRCIRNETVVLKSPTVYTLAGLSKLPEQLREKVIFLDTISITFISNQLCF